MFNLYATELQCADGSTQNRPIVATDFVDAMKQLSTTLPAKVERITIKLMEEDCKEMSSEKLQRCYEWKATA